MSREAQYAIKALGWIVGGDTGSSSKTIWAVMMGAPSDPSIPLDPDDFGRCYRLLRLMPRWRARMGEVAAAHPEWAPLVAVWDELTDLYESEMTGRCDGTAPRLYARMRQLRGE